jgi:threonine dehydratase
MKLPNFTDVKKAVQSLKGYAHKTNVMTSTTINNELGALLNGGKGGKIQIFFKCENMQKTGSFKFRGAFNAINNLSP